MNTQTRTSGTDTATLGLGMVLVGSLPASLMTDEAPDRYTVEAVFTRRPLRDEAVEILGRETRDFLSKTGYPNTELTISDRRLEIANTNLEELRDGLASILADRLAEISNGVQAQKEAAAIAFRNAAEIENTRTAAVTTLAESIIFTPSKEKQDAAADELRTLSDRAQINDWTDEGGHGRS
ncbi:hypothetical protein QBL02_03650 [Leucobacter sp. UT-8R-CII-1-4]|uniref:hypothetical protein n=1 Tax=Leucobacter sp. UT-8R-CII-1-4 TaxID=3040075 RepID=UPI0024A9F0CF|nr:hypothetical protein [Leucobacter sp. UT-8R-CII-1-4]MDI6022634.1 hypothetical protein [Leucobacter sp. UT-8R-CII-1-4]